MNSKENWTLDKKLRRNESTAGHRKIWEAVDRAAERAPRELLDQLKKKAEAKDEKKS